MTQIFKNLTATLGSKINSLRLRSRGFFIDCIPPEPPLFFPEQREGHAGLALETSHCSLASSDSMLMFFYPGRCVLTHFTM